MKHTLLSVIALCAIALAVEHSTAPEYFKYSRNVQVASKAVQNYFVVDLTMWQNMRPDLGDMRLYSRAEEVPYTLRIQRGERSLLQEPAKILDLGSRGNTTEFKLQIGAAEYDTISLKL